MLAPNTFAILPALNTRRLILRRYTLDDAQDLFEIASNPEVTRYTSWEHHKSIQDALEFLNRVIPTYNDPKTKEWTWAIVHKADRKVIGSMGMWGEPEHARAEIGYVIGRAYWGQGLVTEAASEVLRLGLEELGLNKIEAMCHPANTGSYRVMEKIGMTYEGTLREHVFMKGSYWDWKVYSILRKEYYEQNNKGDQG